MELKSEVKQVKMAAKETMGLAAEEKAWKEKESWTAFRECETRKDEELKHRAKMENTGLLQLIVCLLIDFLLLLLLSISSYRPDITALVDWA